jgi:hypothetical protein
MSDIYQEIERNWAALYQKMSCEAPSRAEFSDLCAETETENRRQGSDGLQPWLGIFEFGIEWLSYIHHSLDTRNGVNQHTPCYQVTWALVGAAVSFGLSIRTLCLSGFDTPARALLRSYVEALLLCLAVLHDEGLAQDYRVAQDGEQVKAFWHKIASPKNLHNRIIQIEKTLGVDQDTIALMKNYRIQEYEILSQSAHLSYPACVNTVFVSKLGSDLRYDDSDLLHPGILGLATEASVRTIHYAAITNWYFSCIGYHSILGRDASKCLLLLDMESDLQRRIVIGRDVLSSITRTGIGMEENGASVNAER